MTQVKLKIHSVVDVITNSSTVIYTHQDGCIAPARELISEILLSVGETKNVDEIFSFSIETEKWSESTYLTITTNDPKYDWICDRIICLLKAVRSEEAIN